MNLHDVRLLQQVRGYPNLTIILPTHRTALDNRQDPVRLKNLISEATNRLLSEFGKREVEALLKRLEDLAGGIDFNRTLDGLALFVNQDFARLSSAVHGQGTSHHRRDLCHARSGVRA